MIEAAKESIHGFLKEIDGRPDNVHISVAYTGTDTTVANAFVELVKEEFGVTDVVCNPLSLSVSCHIGDGALAIALSKALPEEL